jgi:hypothetical protein
MNLSPYDWYLCLCGYFPDLSRLNSGFLASAGKVSREALVLKESTKNCRKIVSSSEF